jgi:hypothetical protein
MARQRIELAPAEAAELSRRARATTVPVRDRQRAEIILLSAQGLTQLRIAEQIGTSRLSVNRWVGRFALHRLAGLTDRAGRGRKPWLPPGHGAASARASGDAAAPSGAVELPHDGPRRRDLAGQRAASVGGQ